MLDLLPRALCKSLCDVQVVINSYGREKWYVERAIGSFLRQKYRPARIHFIDQNDTPLHLAPALYVDGLLLHHHRPDKNCSRARNFAGELIRTGWIAFADDDACWADDYSERLCELLAAQPSLRMIAGSVYNDQTGRPYSIRNRLGGRLDTFHGTKLFRGANFVVWAQTFAVVGGYDPRIGPGTKWASSEDADLCWRVVASGARVLYAPQLRILHPPMHTADIAHAVAKARGYGFGRGALCVIWIRERHHWFGLMELAEMTAVPLVKIGFALLRADWAQLRIQGATLAGRHVGFWRFLWQHPRA
jgi:GT2 family glycosyltransferase